MLYKVRVYLNEQNIMDLVVLKCVTSNKLTWNNSCIDTEKDCSYTNNRYNDYASK